MAPSLIRQEQSLETVYEALVYTHLALQSDPGAKGHAKVFKTLLATDFPKVFAAERAARLRHVTALVEMSGADRQCDAWLDRFHNQLLTTTGNRKDVPTYTRYFGDASPSVLKKPVLGHQLAVMASWVPSLVASSEPVLAGLGKELSALVEAGQKATAAFEAARGALRDFREVGERKAFVDQVNAARQSVGGLLAEFVHAHPEKMLPSDWPDGFFRQKVRGRVAAEDRASLTLAIGELETELSEKKAQLAELDRLEAEAKKEAEERTAALARLQAIADQQQAAETEAKALRDRLAQPKKPGKPRKTK